MWQRFWSNDVTSKDKNETYEMMISSHSREPTRAAANQSTTGKRNCWPVEVRIGNASWCCHGRLDRHTHSANIHEAQDLAGTGWHRLVLSKMLCDLGCSPLYKQSLVEIIIGGFFYPFLRTVSERGSIPIHDTPRMPAAAMACHTFAAFPVGQSLVFGSHARFRNRYSGTLLLQDGDSLSEDGD